MDEKCRKQAEQIALANHLADSITKTIRKVLKRESFTVHYEIRGDDAVRDIAFVIEIEPDETMLKASNEVH